VAEVRDIIAIVRRCCPQDSCREARPAGDRFDQTAVSNSPDRGQLNTPVAGVRGGVEIMLLLSDDFIPNITNATLMMHMG
jgi:hypothetical protein